MLVGAKTVKIVAGSSVTVSKDWSSPVAFKAAQSVEKSSSEHATPVIVHGSYSSDPSDVESNGSGISVGCVEGIMLRVSDDSSLGNVDGTKLGISDGIMLGDVEGTMLGISEGKSLGGVEGTMLGKSDGKRLGFVDGTKLGMSDGIKVLVELGSGVSSCCYANETAKNKAILKHE